MNGLSCNAWRDRSASAKLERAQRQYRRHRRALLVAICWLGAVAAGLGWMLGAAP